jgi:predicted DCC family thiol-disulfide oxidoreductase YuxK
MTQISSGTPLKGIKECALVNKPIVFYDGVCGLCNRLVQFLLKRDKHDRLLFASLQSDFASKVLARHGIDPKDLDTLHVVENYEQSDESVLDRSDAILRAGKELGGIWAEVADLGAKVPQDTRDRFYRFVAKNRYYLFGKYQTCMLPEPQHRAKFLDME